MAIPKPFLDASTLNFTIQHGIEKRDYAREVRKGERRLGFFILPPFQRPAVWTQSQKVRFIESIWLQLPIGSYAVNRDDRHEKGYPCENWLLDGQQRWTAIIEYTSDSFPVFDLLYSELELRQRRHFENHPFPAIQTRNLTPKQCREVYDRLAYGGTNHE